MLVLTQIEKRNIRKKYQGKQTKVRPEIVDLFKQETGSVGPSVLCIPERMPSNGSFSKQGLLGMVIKLYRTISAKQELL